MHWAAIQVFVLQSMAVAGNTPSTPVQGIHNYLKGAELRRPCGEPDASGDIVVCGRQQDNDAYRLRSPDDRGYSPQQLRAEVGIGGGATLKVAEVSKVLMPGEQKSQPDKPSARYAPQARITLTVPLSALH